MHLDLTLPALGCAVLHSLWELAALGLLAWVVLRVTAGRSARLRYGLALGFLGLMLLAPALTLIHFSLDRISAQTLVWVSPQIQTPSAAPEPADAFTLVPGAGAVPGAHPWIGSFSSWSGRLWLLGCLFMSLRLLLTWVRERSLFHRDLAPVEDAWVLRLRECCIRLKLKRTVQLRISSRASSPMTWGWLKPIVLLPAASLLHLGPAALEAILLHELAHVRRLDYLAGLLQSIAEVLLFYHPALWWLSCQIRELRELCCDDMVMELLGDPLPYAEGLASLERLRRQELPRLVQASQQGNLMFRITRMLSPDSIRPLKLNVLAIPLAVGLAGGLLLASSRGTQTSTTTSQSVVFSYSTGAVKALRIEGYDIALAKAVAAPMDERSQASHDAWVKAWEDSRSTIVEWTIAQLRLRLEALRRGETPKAATFEAPPNDMNGMPKEMPCIAIEMTSAKPGEHPPLQIQHLFAIHPPVEGRPGAVTLHLSTLEASGPVTPERESSILQEALELMQSTRGDRYSWTDSVTTREQPAPPPVVQLPVPATGTHFLISTGEGRSLRLVGFENLVPKGEFEADRFESQLKDCWSWARARIRERVKALQSGDAKPLIAFSELPLSFSGTPKDAINYTSGDMTALTHGQPGQLFSIHRACGGQRVSMSFRLPSLEAFKGRMPTKDEELGMLQEALALLEKQERGEIGENVAAVSGTDAPPKKTPLEGSGSIVVVAPKQ